MGSCFAVGRRAKSILLVLVMCAALVGRLRCRTYIGEPRYETRSRSRFKANNPTLADRVGRTADHVLLPVEACFGQTTADIVSDPGSRGLQALVIF